MALGGSTIQVGWSASLSGGIVGTGTVSGSLGVFDVTATPQSFLLPASLPATVVGFPAGFSSTLLSSGTVDKFTSFVLGRSERKSILCRGRGES
jgi:hypothetical protein